MKNTMTAEKVRAGQPYLYRKNGIPSEVYEVRMIDDVEHGSLNAALDMTMERYPYFKVRYEEHEGDFYAVENDLPIEAYESEALIPLGGEENNYYLIGVTHHVKSICVSFHHGLADGRGVKSFVETLIYHYCQTAYGSTAGSEGILTADAPITEAETSEPCGDKYKIDRKALNKIVGVSRKGFTLPETKAAKSAHRRRELKFPQKDFIALCKASGASPVVMLSVMMSRAIRGLYPDSREVINSNFPVDARAALGCEGTYKNCVKSISLPYGDNESQMSAEELCRHYKRLMNEQRTPERCKDEFNKIIMLLNAVSHLRSFGKKRAVMKMLDDLRLDTYLISYIGQFRFHENERYVESVHLYSDCSSGLVMNMTCQCGYFIIDFTQDFEGDKYVNALAESFANAGIALSVSDEIIYSTPCDTLMRDMPVEKVIDTGYESLWDKTVSANVNAYYFVERKAVGVYAAIENAFVRTFLLKDGETVADAKLRLTEEQVLRSIAKREELLKIMYKEKLI
ncbi:hypothetical protein SAMN02910447_01991 [Ruminococcus sp. YE71]|uniref:hypothetical protein n=1 Tax=unclassified Ruminococcus TaxID=2608920 RepID=UPI00087E423D|nr:MULTISPECIES: hypothetical protein [unclassified Ruminococcus]SDA25874.1 hypothetical protein SAMN02910446_02575 [Ruminococcus sp. YE78]SFW35536.1 hypothetical protein SAMN02910447_01991 [Ruminococcus sp. YE71]